MTSDQLKIIWHTLEYAKWQSMARMSTPEQKYNACKKQIENIGLIPEEYEAVITLITEILNY